LNGIDRLQWH